MPVQELAEYPQTAPPVPYRPQTNAVPVGGLSPVPVTKIQQLLKRRHGHTKGTLKLSYTGPSKPDLDSVKF